MVSCFHVGDSFVDMRGGLYVQKAVLINEITELSFPQIKTTLVSLFEKKEYDPECIHYIRSLAFAYAKV